MQTTMANGFRIKHPHRFALLLAVSLLQCETRAGSQLEDLATQAGYKILAPGDSSSAAQRRASESLPVNRMKGPARNRAVSAVRQCNQFRHLPELQYSADPAMYRYLIQHPDVAVSTWRVMGISKFEMWQTGRERYEAKAVDGSEGVTDVLYRDHQQCVFICNGSYQNPLLPKSLDAGALVWIRWNFQPMSDGTYQVTQKADAFIVFESQGLSTFAKVLTPVTNTMMDRNLFEVSLYAGLMSRAVRDEPEWVIDVAQQLDGVLPQRRTEMMNIARQRRPTSTAEAARRRQTEERQAFLSSGISLFAPPVIPEDLAAVPELTAPPVPPVPLISGAETAASSSAADPAASGTVSLRTVSVSTTGEVPVTVESTPAAKTQDGFELQPTVTPPGKR
jgi:hypothetical protein